MIRCLAFICLLIHTALAQKGPASPPKKWLTLRGNQPLVIARGGFSGLFPESCEAAIQLALSTSLQDTAIMCNLQMTKDGVGFCLSGINLDNSTTMGVAFPKGQKSYNVNGRNLTGWFSVDYLSAQIFSKQVALTQNTYSRSSAFDGAYPISSVQDVIGQKPPKFWLNVQYPTFYSQRRINIADYVQKSTVQMRIDYVSSPEIGFLKRLRVNRATKIVFHLLGVDDVEPTTSQTYGALVKDLAMIKTFASGILVPKEYIWPVKPDKYLGVPTTLVSDAHKQGLEVYASGFANDYFASYNYSYDPTLEYLQFIDNNQFSVDGLVTDFPPTASQAVACYAQNRNGTKPTKGQTLVITHNGASGVYAGSTDLAYQQAVDDGADIIDCSVQITKDGVPFCLDTADLMGDTTAMTTFVSRASSVPEIQPNSGIFSFDLTWSEIQTLKPQLVSPFPDAGFPRNPANKNSGKFLTLTEFLEFANAKAVTGVLINIQNAAYLASKRSLDIVAAVRSSLSNTTFDKQSTQQVLIQSDDTSVLSLFKDNPNYKRVLTIDEKIGSAPKHPVEEVKKYADAVNIPRGSIIEDSDSFTTGNTTVVKQFHDFNISVYVNVLRNEYITLAFDYFSDPTIEVATFAKGVNVDGVVTEFPGTAARYLRNPCSNFEDPSLTYAIYPAETGALLDAIPPESQPPAAAPLPPLDDHNVVDPPLPALGSGVPTSPPAAGGPSQGGGHSGALVNAANLGITLLAITVFYILSTVH